MALDEPREDDRTQVLDEITFVVSPKDERLILTGGPIRVWYSDQGWWKGLRAAVSNPAACC